MKETNFPDRRNYRPRRLSSNTNTPNTTKHNQTKPFASTVSQNGRAPNKSTNWRRRPSSPAALPPPSRLPSRHASRCRSEESRSRRRPKRRLRPSPARRSPPGLWPTVSKDLTDRCSRESKVPPQSIGSTPPSEDSYPTVSLLGSLSPAPHSQPSSIDHWLIAYTMSNQQIPPPPPGMSVDPNQRKLFDKQLEGELKSFIRHAVFIARIIPKETEFASFLDLDRAEHILERYRFEERSVPGHKAYFTRHNRGHDRPSVNEARRWIWNNHYLAYSDSEAAALRSAAFVSELTRSPRYTKWIDDVQDALAATILQPLPNLMMTCFTDNARDIVQHGVTQADATMHTDRLDALANGAWPHETDEAWTARKEAHSPQPQQTVNTVATVSRPVGNSVPPVPRSQSTMPGTFEERRPPQSTLVITPISIEAKLRVLRLQPQYMIFARIYHVELPSFLRGRPRPQAEFKRNWTLIRVEFVQY
ncbi:hypothetical protein BJ508DRAFT_314141 [Ascobolus immersus RN42]|uniref:Uncharacterized protein n=1 Tax=Ascobolus immersus RN42 TaxID=1160509 RepID=A0A3N4HI79_ASCIM|nr:hypothetical protein BJ508DRAFT_314141 [Ascobolus immersus RN42]